jgi:predicted dehydrogenase
LVQGVSNNIVITIKGCAETEWRKNPTHQGGFLLDAGVHFAAGLRLLLGPENIITRLSAFTTQLRKDLPPVDTMDATIKTRSGATGTFSVSFGSTLTGSEWIVACEVGSVSVSDSMVTTVFDGKEEKKEVKDERTGVPPEVRKWGQSLAKGTRNERQIPEEALADLELVCCR